jgi:phage shock protein PspC (stress-responsive transcriptional regulator)
MKKIERSNDKVLGGVCAGLARYLDVDPIYLRLLSVLAVFFTGGTAILVYLLCWIIIPIEQKSGRLEIHDKGSAQEEIEVDHSAYSEKITSQVKKLLIVGAFGLTGCVAGAIIGFFMVGSSAGNVLIPILGIIGLIIGGVLGIIAAVMQQTFTS